MRISVMVSTHRRPRDLTRCLNALGDQTSSLHEVLLMTRKGDAETDAALLALEGKQIKVRRIILEEQISPMEVYTRGLKEVTGDILAITHDDAAPLPDWAERLTQRFASGAKVGAVGGPEIFPRTIRHNVPQKKIGKVHWYGKILGNHHHISDGFFAVDFITGANCAYRTQALKEIGGFDPNLCWQKDSMWFWDLSIGLRLKHAGWQIQFDSNCITLHYPGALFTGGGSGYWKKAARCRAQNETYIMLSQYYESQFSRMFYLFWCIFVGTTDNYGIVQMLRYLRKDRTNAFRKYYDGTYGRYQGVLAWRRFS